MIECNVGAFWGHFGEKINHTIRENFHCNPLFDLLTSDSTHAPLGTERCGLGLVWDVVGEWGGDGCGVVLA